VIRSTNVRLSRRELLRLAAAATSLGLAPRVAAAQAPLIPSWPTELRLLAPGVYAYTQASGPGVDNASLSNAGVIVGPDGLLAIDTLGPPIHAKAFKATAEAATRRRFTRVVNTHHHRDHTNGNCFFTGAEIVASEYTRDATIEQGIPAMPYDTRPEWQAGMKELTLAPPTTTIAGKTTYRMGDLIVELIPNAPAHTWGDVMVHLPQLKLLFAADIAFYYVTPPAHNGHITKWIEAIDRIERMDVDVIVPGHGPVGSKRELRETRAYLELVAEQTRKRWMIGMSPGRAAADIDVGRFSSWTNPERTAWNTVRLYAEFNGTITPANDLTTQDAAVKEYLQLKRR
jgi:cyclase